MLNKGLRNQESIRIDNILRTLHSLVFIPKLDDEDFLAIDEQLKGFGLNIEKISEIAEEELIQLIQSCHLDWEQQERFADILVQMSQQNQFHLLEKAIAIYNYIQAESKTFSFEIFNKIASTKANL